MNKDHYISQFYNKPWYIYNGSTISGPTEFSKIVELSKSNANYSSYYLCQLGMSAWQKMDNTIKIHSLLQEVSVEEEKNNFKNTVEQQIKKINSQIHTQETNNTPTSLEFNQNFDSYSDQENPDFKKVIQSLKSELSTATVPTSKKYLITNTKETPSNKINTSTISTPISTVPTTSSEFSESNINQSQNSNNNLSSTNLVSDDSTNKLPLNQSPSDIVTNNQIISSKQSLNQTNISSKKTTNNTSIDLNSKQNINLNSTPTSSTPDSSKQGPKLHSFQKITSKNRTYKKSLTVPPPSQEMLSLLVSNQLRLGEQKSSFTVSIILPLFTFGIYYLYWLLNTYQSITKHLAIGFSPLFFLSYIPILHFIGYSYLLCLYDRMIIVDSFSTTALVKKIRPNYIKNFFISLLLGWCPPLFSLYLQNKLNHHWRTHSQMPG